MKNVILSIDVGGTFTRLRIEITKNRIRDFISDEYRQKINSKSKLKKFIKTSLDDIEQGLTPNHCIIGFAGAVIDHRKVEITNWKNRPTVTINDLIKWGFPKNNTLMLNDMELAAYGILDMIDNGEINSDKCEVIYKPEKQTKNRLKNKLIIAPGTGFGTASILEFSSQTGDAKRMVLSSEIQHIQVPVIDDRHAEIIKTMNAMNRQKSYLNYEDFVSGSGLKNIYLALYQMCGTKTLKYVNAVDIAESAVNENDELAIEALDLFYKLTGRLIQAMALMIQPYGGIYLCGSSTINNAKFIKQSKLIDELHNCLIRKQLLAQFPVYIIKKSDINLVGGLWAGKKVFQDAI